MSYLKGVITQHSALTSVVLIVEMGFFAFGHLLFVLELVTREAVHAVILVVEDVRGDIIMYELYDEVDWVLGWPVKLFIIVDIPSVSRVSWVQEERLIDISRLFHECPRRWV